MLIILSDLHLVDRTERTTIDGSALIDALDRSIAEHALEADEVVCLVLLGDTFELLKSDRWLTSGVRPWHDDDSGVSRVAQAIFSDIANTNAVFFDGLDRLRRKYSLQIKFIPGNHDGLFARPQCVGLRRALRAKLPGQRGDDELFDLDLTDTEHGLTAEHGHEFDDFNRTPTGGRFVPGDAVVIELVTQLARHAAMFFDLDPNDGQFDERLLFLQELDNVRPQGPDGLLMWIERHLSTLEPGERRVLEVALMDALRKCVETLRSVLHRYGTSNALLVRLSGPLQWSLDHASFHWVSKLRRWPSAIGNELGLAELRMASAAQLSADGCQAYDLFVAGHTHLALKHDIAIEGRRMTYLNTGTWRRVHLAVKSRGGVEFATFYDETILCVYRRRTRNAIRYAFKRQIRGA